MEHDIWFDEPAQRWYKVTHPGECGRHPEVEINLDKQTQQWKKEVLLRLATPKEYLERLRLQNVLFGDDLRLEGLSVRAGKFCVVTSQPVVAGRTPSLEEIHAFMTACGFSECADFMFYDGKRRLAAFDAQPKNFRRTRGGQVLPIDLILAPAEELHEALGGTPAG